MLFASVSWMQHFRIPNAPHRLRCYQGFATFRLLDGARRQQACLLSDSMSLWPRRRPGGFPRSPPQTASSTHAEFVRPAAGCGAPAAAAAGRGKNLLRTPPPTALLLTRQKVPPIDRTATGELADPSRGGYLVSGEGRPDAILVGTGSELHVAVKVQHAFCVFV